MAIAPQKKIFNSKKNRSIATPIPKKKPTKTRPSRIVITVFTHGSIC